MAPYPFTILNSWNRQFLQVAPPYFCLTESGKLGLVKDLLRKLEHALNNQRHQSSKKIEIDTFLDTPLLDFLSSTEVVPPTSSYVC